MVQVLISKANANPNFCNNTGWSSLHHATYYGHYDTCRILVENGAKLDIQNHLGATALHVGVARGHITVVRYKNILYAYTQIYLIIFRRFSHINR